MDNLFQTTTVHATCCFFAGDGYCRSEAVTAIFLQKSAECKRIYATVLHTKVNSDGYKEEGILSANCI